MMGVYEILNLENGRSYVGSSHDVDSRWSQHKRELRKGCHGNQHLQRAFDKYSEESFSFCMLEWVMDKKELLEREQFYLDRLFETDSNCYNIARKAACPPSPLGKPVSEQTRRKRSERMKGKQYFLGHSHTEETRRKLSAIHSGKTLSEEHKRKLRIAMIGKVASEETRRKMSIAKKGVAKPAGFGRKISEYRKGRKLSESTKMKISEAQSQPYPAFIHRDTKEIIPAGNNLAKICRQKDLNRGCMNFVQRGMRKHHKGWMLLKEDKK